MSDGTSAIIAARIAQSSRPKANAGFNEGTFDNNRAATAINAIANNVHEIGPWSVLWRTGTPQEVFE